MLEAVLLYTGIAASTICLTAGYLCTLSRKDKAPKLFHSNSEFSQYVIQNVSRLREPYHPTGLLRNLHLQTLLPVFLPKPKVLFEREVISLKDGGILALDWCLSGNGHAIKEDAPVMIAIPGLTGDKRSMSQLCKQAAEKGFRAVVFNKRGHGHSSLATPKLQAFGDPEDFRQAVIHIKENFPKAKISSVGFSAGSGLLASYSGEYGKSSHLSATVYISAGYQGYALLNKVPKFYAFFLLKGLKDIISQHSEILSKVIDVKAALNVKTLGDFEREVYTKIYGHKTLEEYWKHNEPMRNIKNVDNPGLAISSSDDPICIKEFIAFDIFDKNPNYMLAYTEHGGHCGFLEGWKMESWAIKLSVDYIQAVLDYETLSSK